MDVASPTPRARVSAGSRWRRRLSTLCLVAGFATLLWVVVVWQYNDPFTSLYTRWEQRHLNDQLAALVETERSRASRPSSGRPPDPARAVAADARRLGATVGEGDAIGRIIVPRLGLSMVLVNGTATDSLKKGPGRERSTSMPGEGGLIYIAGHRTTYLAPFARIDRLRSGDRVTLVMPYATFTYAVTEHRIVDDQDLSVLRSRGREEVALQACHPRFFATQRYVVWARMTRMTLPSGKVVTAS